MNLRRVPVASLVFSACKQPSRGVFPYTEYSVRPSGTTLTFCTLHHQYTLHYSNNISRKNAEQPVGLSAHVSMPCIVCSPGRNTMTRRVRPRRRSVPSAPVMRTTWMRLLGGEPQSRVTCATVDCAGVHLRVSLNMRNNKANTHATSLIRYAQRRRSIIGRYTSTVILTPWVMCH
jgi:hypothetical protein